MRENDGKVIIHSSIPKAHDLGKKSRNLAATKRNVKRIGKIEKLTTTKPDKRKKKNLKQQGKDERNIKCKSTKDVDADECYWNKDSNLKRLLQHA